MESIAIQAYAFLILISSQCLSILTISFFAAFSRFVACCFCNFIFCCIFKICCMLSSQFHFSVQFQDLLHVVLAVSFFAAFSKFAACCSIAIFGHE